MRKYLVFVLVLGGVLITACDQNKFLGSWEVDVEKTLAQYDKPPEAWSAEPLQKYQDYFRREFAGRVYKFTTARPRKPEWGETHFQGTVESQREGKMQFYGAWRMATNQPGTYVIFRYTVNSGASYWPVGNIRMSTNSSELLWYGSPEDKQPRILCRK